MDKLKARVVCAVVTLLVQLASPVASLTQENHDPNYKSLSGIWEGTYDIHKIGKCSIDSSNHFAWVTFDIKPDGTFRASVSFRGPKDKKARTWVGSFDKDRRLQATEDAKATCNNQTRKYEATFSGTIIETEGKLFLEIEGRLEACPDQGCIFKVVYRITKKS